jgi:8-oxo-dGTP pyrophosphatase MutT (NUDIX family)
MFATNDPRYYVATALQAYTPDKHGQEQVYKMLMTEHLFYQQRCLFRDCFFPGHFTASAWVVNPKRSKILLLNHPKLNKWLQPGGHADGQGELHKVALRELMEETGVSEAQVKWLGGGVFDLDIHYVPPAQKQGRTEPEHLHLDVRYAFEVDDQLPLISPEGIELKWFTLEEAQPIFMEWGGRMRMLEKTKAL